MTSLAARGTAGMLEIHAGHRLVLGLQAEARLDDGSAAAAEVSAREVSGGCLRLALSFRNDGPAPIRLDQLALTAGACWGAPPAQLLAGGMGWQSWSRPQPLLPFRPDAMPLDLIREPITPGRLPNSQVLPCMALLQAPGQEPLLIGFTGARHFTGLVELAAGQLRAWCDLEGRSLPPGERIEAEPVLVAAGPEPEVLAAYAEAAAAEMAARRWPGVPTGWCSWYHFYAGVSEQDCLRNLEVLARLRDRLPIEVFQLDDGYQREVGDWLTLNAKFPSGMPALVGEIRRHGFQPGIWLAPFLLSARSRTYADHPDWVVRDEDGRPLNAVGNWGSENYALDTTQPAALDWIEHVVDAMCRGWGYDYLKIDFIYAGAVRGHRQQPQVSAVEAYRRGVERIRRIAGDRFILGCGAPFLSSVGLVDGMRIGEDVAPFWQQPQRGAGPAMTNALHSTLLHSWMHSRWWINDPDCLMVRAHDTQLTLEEVRAWAGVVALSGGMVLVSDDLSTLEPDRLELLQRLFPAFGHAAQALPPYAGELPERLALRVQRPWDEWLIAGIANWADEPREANFDPADWGLPGGPYHLVDLWTGEYRGPLRGRTGLNRLRPHEMHLLSVHADLGRPQVVGSTGHVLGEAMDVSGVQWDGQRLAIELAGPRPHRGQLLVHLSGQGVRRLPFALDRDRRLEVTS